MIICILKWLTRYYKLIQMTCLTGITDVVRYDSDLGSHAITGHTQVQGYQKWYQKRQNPRVSWSWKEHLGQSIFPCLTSVLFLFISGLFVRPPTNPKLPPFLSEIPCMLFGFWIVCHFIYSGYEPVLDITIANLFSISYFISHFIDISPWWGFRVWCTHTCSHFLSLLLLSELHPTFIAKTDVQEYSNASFLGAKWFQ